MPSSSAIAASKSLIVGSMSSRHCRVDGALFKRHADGVTRTHRRSVTNDTRTGSVPGHRVAAAEYREGTQPFDSRGQSAESRLQDAEPPPSGGGELRVARHQPRAHGGEPMTRIELIE